MKSTEINAIYAAKVAEFLSAGYTINTNSMNGSQGEIAKIDFRKGYEVIRVLLHSETINYSDNLINSLVLHVAESLEKYFLI